MSCVPLPRNFIQYVTENKPNYCIISLITVVTHHSTEAAILRRFLIFCNFYKLLMHKLGFTLLSLLHLSAHSTA